MCFGPVIVTPIHLGLFSILENIIIGYADDYTLIDCCGAIIRRYVTFVRKKITIKSKTMIVSMSLTTHSQSPPLTIGGTVQKESE